MTESPLTLASRWKRLAAAILDSLITMSITLPVMVFTGTLKRAFQGESLSFGQACLFFIFGLIVFLALNGYLLAKSGQTIGKKVLAIRIVGYHDENLIPLSKVFGLRFLPTMLISQIPLIGGFYCLVDSLFIFRADKRCIHDLIAGSKVVDA